MASYKQFEEMEIWKLSFSLSKSIYLLSQTGEFGRDFSFRDQIRRSSLSIPSNISEGFERESTRQFLYFLNIAKGSCGELRTQLLLAQEINYISSIDYTTLSSQCIEISKQIKGLMKYLTEHEKQKNK